MILWLQPTGERSNVQARFDHERLAVETIRYFHGYEEPIDPLADEAPAPVLASLHRN